MVTIIFGQNIKYCKTMRIFKNVREVNIQNVMDLASLRLVFFPLKELRFVSVSVLIRL